MPGNIFRWRLRWWVARVSSHWQACVCTVVHPTAQNNVTKSSAVTVIQRVNLESVETFGVCSICSSAVGVDTQ